MSRVGIEVCRNKFTNDVAFVSTFLRESQALHIRSEDGSFRRLTGRQVEHLASSALLRLQLAWEDFLEESFTRYMCGSSSMTGVKPTLLRSRSRGLTGAMAELLQGKSFLNWSYDETVSRANAYFSNGEPFRTAMAAAKQTIENVATVRNAIAHRSEYSQNRFRTVVRDEVGYVRRGMTPGRFLLTIPSGAQEPIIERYKNHLGAVVALISA